MILIKNATIYNPDFMGINDILVAGDKIISVEQNIELNTNALEIEIIDANDKIIIPGYIDQHVHVIGGGGEDGPHSRTPEVVLSNVIKAGVTTLIGVLGTDATTRHLESLLAKVQGLEKEGVTTYMLTGAYEVPLVTILEDARRDIILIDKVLGIGEVAISDHRSSQPTLDELKRIVTQGRLGGMLSGKAGATQFHVGDGKSGISMLFDIIHETEIPPNHLIPTHINRSHKLLKEGMEFAKLGGYIDMTACMGSSELTTPIAIRLCKENNVPMTQITMSSDGNGSMTKYDDKGKVTGLTAAKMDTLHQVVKDTILSEKIPPEEVFAMCTKNPAQANGLWPQKGAIAKDSDADLLILDKNYDILSVMAKGKFMLKNKQLLVKGTFE
ncbi:beta-aspartyl-peptidase [Candidatus Epulonipiscioides gigas]|nr:beta-aspartyl-peptidase [Epulopiscium sp. SCG-C07WGA-EpuloA2]